METAKQIPLTQGAYAIVDAQDYDRIAKRKWSVKRDKITSYAVSHVVSDGRRTKISMHRAIMNTPKGQICDHINRNGLDNRRCNLRPCSIQQNNCNRQKPRNAKSRFKGVYFDKKSGKFSVQIKINKKIMHLGSYSDEAKAAEVYDAKAKEVFGEFAVLNFNKIS